MRLKSYLWGLGLGLSVAATSVRAQDPYPSASGPVMYLPVAAPADEPKPSAPAAKAVPSVTSTEKETVTKTNTGDWDYLPATCDLPNMLGDFAGTLVSPAPFSPKFPSPRSFKIADNQSPAPHDRVYFGFNYFDDVGDDVNARLHPPYRNARIYRETFGFEQTLLDENVSVGLRIPINSFTMDIFDDDFANTDVGDLTLILKGLLVAEDDYLISAGLAISFPTGEDSLAGDFRGSDIHETTFQPFVGYAFLLTEDIFLHGFSAIDIPTEDEDVTLWFNDVGIGCWLYRSADWDRLITAVVPTFEVHVNSPLDHQGVTDFGDVTGFSDEVNLVTGTTLELYGCSTLAIGVITPVAGPNPFDFGVLAQLNVRFGTGKFFGY